MHLFPELTAFLDSIEARSRLPVSCDEESQLSGSRPTGLRR